MHSINSGEYPIGSFLPNELQLAETEKVSRHTVRAALKVLEQYGLIKRTPHVGTEVIASGTIHSFDQQLASLSDLNQLAATNPRKIQDIREVVVSKELAKQLRCAPGETFIRFSMIRLGNNDSDLPIAWTSEYVNRHWKELILEAPKHPELLMIDLISRTYGRRCSEIKQSIEATTLPQEAARHLQAQVGTPCLRIHRCYVNEAGRTLLITVSYLPADRYAFCLNIKLSH